MSTLNLETDDGKVLQLGEDDVVFFIDETGHEFFSDERYPIFGLGGCGMTVKYYAETVRIAWLYMKREFFGLEGDTHFHAADLKPEELTDVHLAALSHFWSKFEFFRIAALATDKSLFDDGMLADEVVYATLKRRILDVLKYSHPFSKLHIMFEASDRLDDRTMRNFSDFKFLDRGEGKMQIPVEKYIMPKTACEPGLEIADFIIHTSGAQTKARFQRKLTQPDRKDFQLVWHSIPNELTSFMEITKGVYNN